MMNNLQDLQRWSDNLGIWSIIITFILSVVAGFAYFINSNLQKIKDREAGLKIETLKSEAEIVKKGFEVKIDSLKAAAAKSKERSEKIELDLTQAKNHAKELDINVATAITKQKQAELALQSSIDIVAQKQAPRHLTEYQKRILKDYLTKRPFAGEKSIRFSSLANDNESQSFADELYQLFVDSGWEAERPTRDFLMQSTPGIILQIPGREIDKNNFEAINKIARLLVEALSVTNLLNSYGAIPEPKDKSLSPEELKQQSTPILQVGQKP